MSCVFEKVKEKQYYEYIINFFFICAVGLWALRPLLAYFASLG
jgi:hypothetical protein